MDDDQRGRILAETVDAYARYAETGYEARWSEASVGTDQMGAERDAALIAAIGDTTGATIVDLGCGGGTLALTLERRIGRPGRYIGIDLLEPRVMIARERVPWGEFHTASADRLPIDDESVDVVVAATLFSSIADLRFRIDVAREIGRVLRPHGRAIIYDLRYPSPRNKAVRPVRQSDKS